MTNNAIPPPEEHRTYVERSSWGSYYYWCTADDCYSGEAHLMRPAYPSETEALDAAAAHEQHPG